MPSNMYLFDGSKREFLRTSYMIKQPTCLACSKFVKVNIKVVLYDTSKALTEQMLPDK